MDKIIIDINILHQISKPTTKEEVKELDLVNRLREANKTAWTTGAGLAAIQIGIPLRFAWLVHNGKEYTLLNPEITNTFGNITKDEGCLSIPNTWVIKRAVSIDYISNKTPKHATWFIARLIQHEIDHMNGILITDKD